MKFIRLLKYRLKKLDTEPSLEVTAADLLNAEVAWIREAQRLLMEDPRFDTWSSQFRLIVDEDGLYRCKGRLGNAELPLQTRHPVLMPQQHHLTTLIVTDAHRRVMHNGVKETLAELRTKYWIVKGRQFVRRILQRCVVCQKMDGGPYCIPPSPPLPTFRVNPEPPFTNTGVDFAGPLFVKTSKTQEKNKVWIFLYTCCVVRAVHLDVVPDLSAEAFIRSFKRFTARRDLPKRMISDNGKTFKSAATTIKSILNHPEVQHHFAGIGMEWSFNTEKAPWTGGVFERMVRSMKRCLKKIIGKATLSYDELLTVVTELEMVLNSRPLSYLSSEDIEEPLTPSHLLIGRRVLSLPSYAPHQNEYDLEVSHNSLTRQMKYLNFTLDHFWKRWKTEYLLELRECHRYEGSEGNIGRNTVSVGDVVLVHNESGPRGLWRLARVEDVLIGTDGYARSAIIRVHSKNTNSKLLKRPLRCLYPLEVDSKSCSVSNDMEIAEPERKIEEQRGETVARVRRSQRTATHSAKDGIKTCLLEDSD